MPRRARILTLALRLVLVASACVVLATARLPVPDPARTATLRAPGHAVPTAPRESGPLVRLLLALTLAAGVA
ncbi:MAG TPA: hypothetical protein VFX50_06020, partial [Gemmatimonadales bacterium]|nr:hypothetical protein [Gemmatimonadales bacterium]